MVTMWSLLLLLYTAFTEPLITQGDNRLILINGSHPCEGYIGMYHDGQLGYVGHKTWSENIEKVVCKSTQCGEPKNSFTKTAPSYTWNKVWVNEVTCIGNESHLWDCKYPGWKTSSVEERSLKKIQCSNEIKISLDGFRCAGAVKYQSITGVREKGYLCGDNNWGKDQKDRLCKNLNCGESKDLPLEDWMDWKEFKNSKKMKIDCSDMTDVTHLWQCAPEEDTSCKKPASVMCTDFKRLQLQGNPSNVCSGRLEEMKSNVWSNWSEPVSTNKTGPDVWCQQMHCGTNMNHSTDNGITKLHCSDNVKVVLMSNNQPSKCYGAVNIEVNGSPRPVCATTWTQKEAAVVCKELNCGDVHIKKTKNERSVNGIMDNVKCSGNEASLWHCSAKHVSSCSSEAYVVCSGSMKVRLADGPGKCAGRVEIQYEGRWQQVLEVQKDDNLDAVCKELGCGNERKPINRDEKFCQGSGGFLTVTCKSTDKKISKCTTADSKLDKEAQAKAKAQGITCEEHKVVILNGSDSCSGRVGIKKGTNTKWLSGSKETWNQQSANTVCQQMHCGNALSFNSESNADIQKDVWAQSYNCSSDTKSLFDCEKNEELPSDHRNTSATVKCLGELEVKLSKGCWGNVSVWDGKKNGSVCADNWEEKKAKMLCKNLGCGDRVLTRITKPGESKALFASLHCTDEATNLTQCNFVRNKNGISCEQAYVVCSGSVEYGFSDTRDKCYGNVVVHYEDRRLPVCKTALDNKTQNIICGEQNCGQAVKEIDYFGPKPVENYHISQITYDNKSLTSCDVKLEKDSCAFGGLQCSGWRKMELTIGKACSGDVFVHSQGNISAVSSKGWSATERERLCQDLQCGKYRSNKTTPLTKSVLWPTSFSCKGLQKPENIWDCENPTSSSQGHTTEQQLKIECEGEPSVNLSHTCRGEVKIDGIEVCADQWKDKYSQLVCQEMSCSNAVPDSFHGEKPKPRKQYFHVSCEEYHFKLGQCKRVKKDCKGRLVSVSCVKQIQFNTSEKCGGRIEVNYRNKWEYVCPLTSFPSKLMDSLCVKCDGHNRSIKTPQNESVVTLETTLNYASDTQDIKYCVRTQSCKDVKAAEIYCNKYVFPTIPEPKPIPDRTVEIIVGVGFVLVLVVLIVVFIIICVVRKAKIFSSRKLQRKEVEFESGDYDDVTSKANEMEVLSGGRFPSETEVVTENDARSTSSFPYDDIDDMAVAQPLTSKAATAAASGDNDNHEGDLHQSADGVIYEVDDPQENYEDIEAKIIQTEAEVHNSPQTTPESDAAPPPGLEQGDEDYLVPGQDG